MSSRRTDGRWRFHLARASRIYSCASRTILTCLDIKPLQSDVALSPFLPPFFFSLFCFSLFERGTKGEGVTLLSCHPQPFWDRGEKSSLTVFLIEYDFSYSIPSLFRVMESGSRSPRFDGLELLSPPPLRLTPRNSLSFLVFITCNKTTWIRLDLSPWLAMGNERVGSEG